MGLERLGQGEVFMDCLKASNQQCLPSHYYHLNFFSLENYEVSSANMIGKLVHDLDVN